VGIQPDTGTDPAGMPAGCFGPSVIMSFAIAGVTPGGSFIGGVVAARATVDNASANKNAHVNIMTRTLKTLTPFAHNTY